MQYGRSWGSNCVKMITMKEQLITLLLCVVIAGCRNSTTIGCPDSADHAVLSAMYSDFSDTPNYLTVWLNHSYDSEYWNPIFDRWQNKIDHTRKWAKSIDDRCTRNSYLGWLDYYQHELNSARNELRTQAERKEMEEYDRQRSSERKQANEYAIKHGVPKPPRDKE